MLAEKPRSFRWRYLVIAGCALVLAACGGGGGSDTAGSGDLSPASQGGDSQGDSGAAPVAITAPQRVGYVGCSVTLNAISGYRLLGGEVMWPSADTTYQLAYSGGSINVWALDFSSLSIYWETFNDALAAHPDTDAIWFELCTDVIGASQDTFENAQVVINEILRRAPGVRIFVSAQNEYSDRDCIITGADGPARMQAVADQLVAAGFAEAGPVVGPLSMTQTEDGCHANEAGRLLLGGQLLEFFK